MMLAAIFFDGAGTAVRARVIVPMSRHEVSLMQFVEDDEWSFVRGEIFINPHFIQGHERVHKSVSTFSEVNIEKIADHVAAHDPDSERACAVFA